MKKSVKYICENKVFSIGIFIVSISVFIAIFAPWIVPYNPADAVPKIRMLHPFRDASHILGADYLGRDMLSRIIYGIRISLLISVASVLLSMAVGGIIGLLCGLNYPGPFDTVLMRITDIQIGFPFIVVAIIALSLVEATIPSVIIVLSLATWPAYARNVRSSTMSQKETDYVAAARIMGAKNGRIAFRYIGRNLLPTILPTVSLDIAGTMISESLLSYINLGLNPPIISLGNIMADGASYISTEWWLTGVPGVVILLIVLGFNFIGDNLQRKVDPLLNK